MASLFSDLPSKEILTSQEVLALLGISKSTLKRYRKKGLKSYKKGHLIFFKYSDIIKWLTNK